METRILIAYTLLALMVTGMTLVWFKLSREWRQNRRAHLRGARDRRRRRVDRLREEGGA